MNSWEVSLEILVVILVVAVVIACFIDKPDARPPDHTRTMRDMPPTAADRSQKPTFPAKPSQKPNRQPVDLNNQQEPKPRHAPPPPIPSSRKLKGKAYIIDGDTIVIHKIKIRLAGIDAPELDQPWGQKSKWEMVKICKGQVIDVELTGETSYDRLVGTCFLPDGRDIGAEIIKAGLALDGGHFSKGKYRHLEPDGVRQRLKRYGHWRK
ncbi:thermonuclease family protein [Algirhabdus cladophorae]|uniref:thermonuclease family protein n=1 Tax=Algirhabdus cladophorae TaxID=3377108 RepID=UPI003B849E81